MGTLLVSIYIILTCFYTAYAPEPQSTPPAPVTTPPAPVQEKSGWPFFRLPFMAPPPTVTPGSQLPSQPLKEGETVPSGWPTPTRPEEMPPKKGFVFQFPFLPAFPQNEPKVKTLADMKNELSNIVLELPALARRSVNLNRKADQMTLADLDTKIQEIKDRLKLLVGETNKNGENPIVELQKKVDEMKSKVVPHVTQFLEERGKAVQQTVQVIGSSPIAQAIGNNPIAQAIGAHPMTQNVANYIKNKKEQQKILEPQDASTQQEPVQPTS